MNDNWSDFEKWVFTEFKEVRKDIGSLRERAAVWGALAGLVPVIIGLLIQRALKQ